MLTLPYTGILLGVLLSVAFGYLIGRVDALVFRGLAPAPSSAPTTNTLRAALHDSAREKAKIEINTGKYVGEIDTTSMQKTQQLALGKTTQTQDDISASVSKLAQLKGK
jgi:hypothetical protein